MNHDKERALIKSLLNNGVINQQEMEKAELYLSLSSTTFENYPDAIQWLIYNRAVSRDRQDHVTAVFERSGLADTIIETENTKPEAIFTAPVTQHINVTQTDSVQPKRSTSSSVTSDITIPYEIYQYNLQMLKAFDQKYGVPNEQYTEAENLLKKCPYLFCHNDEIGNWISSYFIEPIDLEEEEEILDSVTALQLYNLVTKQALIDPIEYDCCYWELLDTENARPFRNETLLANWLKEQGCILSEDEAITLTPDNLEHNKELVKKLLQKKRIKKGELFSIFKLLAENPQLKFESEQRLHSWIKSQKLPLQKKKFPIFFVLFAGFILYKIFSSVLTNEEYEAPGATVVTTEVAQPKEYAEGNYAELSLPDAADDSTIALQDEYVIAVEQALEKLNAMIKEEQGDLAATFANIITRVERTGECSTQNHITTCPFMVHYFADYRIPSYSTKIQFKRNQKNIQVISEYELALALVEGLTEQPR